MGGTLWTWEGGCASAALSQAPSIAKPLGVALRSAWRWLWCLGRLAGWGGECRLLGGGGEDHWVFSEFLLILVQEKWTPISHHEICLMTWVTLFRKVDRICAFILSQFMIVPYLFTVNPDIWQAFCVLRTQRTPVIPTLIDFSRSVWSWPYELVNQISNQILMTTMIT